MPKKTWVFVGIITLVRAVISFFLPLHPDECYYWLLSKHLDLSYFDHPPLVAYLIRLTTIFSDHQFFVRLSTIVFSVLLSILIYRLAFFLFASPDIAHNSTVIFNLYPLTAAGIIITPDTPAFFFFALALFSFARIVFPPDKNPTPHWIYLGIFLGLGLLSKYTTVLFLAGMFIFILLYRQKFLLSPNLYLSLLLSLVIFSPVIIWNWQHNWISFLYQWRHGTSGLSGNWLNILTFWLTQLGIGGIFLFLPGIVGAITFLFARNEQKKFLALNSLPIFIFFSIISYKRIPEANWPGLGFLPLAIIAAVVLTEKISRLKKFILSSGISFSVMLIGIIYLHALFGLLPVSRINSLWSLMDPTNRFYGWKEFSQEIKTIAGNSPIISTEHQSAAAILYYSRQKVNLYCSSNNFVFWQKNLVKGKPLTGRVITYEYFTDVSAGNLNPEMFDRVDNKQEFIAYRNNNIIRKYNIYECWNFRGF